MNMRSSRRVVGLKPTDYDHEITLLDNDNHLSPRPRHQRHNLPDNRNDTGARLQSNHDPQVERTTTNARLLSSGPNSIQNSVSFQTNTDAESQLGPSRRESDAQYAHGQTADQNADQNADQSHDNSTLAHSASRPSIEVQDATPMQQAYTQGHHKAKGEPRETEIDILYENERGGFLCGSALFSAKALGGLDATPWTNAFHKPSLTDIFTAQVPDPTWEWVWPEWRVHYQDGVDEFGWEYSFAFSKKFSWHDGKWWNSFVRRRIWIRRRARKCLDHRHSDAHLLSTDYFSVRPASQRTRNTASTLGSRVNSRSSMAQSSILDFIEELPDIEDLPTLMRILRLARIDREKREAIENYLEHATDIDALQHEMHDVMALFVFQASRRLLLCHLMVKHNEAAQDLEKHDSQQLRQRKDALDAALRHADEEVRKLAYWSDVKHMVASGESRISLDEDRASFYETWQGIDQSGPQPPNEGKLPGPANHDSRA